MTVPANLQAEAAPWGSIPVTPVYGTQGGPYTVVNTLAPLPVGLADIAGQGSINSALPNADGISPTLFRVLLAETFALLWNGSGWDRARTPNVFKTVQASASGDTALWTPQSGKKFRLMKLMVVVPANCTLSARGVLTIKLRDSTTDINLSHDVYLGQTAIAADSNPQQTTLYSSGWIDLGNGYLSSASNNVLNLNLSAALSNGNVRAVAAGTEE